MSNSGIYGVSPSTRYLPGDKDPEEFNWQSYLNASNMLNLLCRNGKVRKATAWVAREAVRPRFILKTDKKIIGTKNGLPYVFDSVIEYLEWIGFFTELEKVLTWARLFGTSIIVLYKEGEPITGMFEPLPLYDSCSAYHPLANSNGYTIVEDGEGKYHYEVTFTNPYGKTITYKISTQRVIIFNAPQLELKYGGSSDVEPLSKLAVIQEQLFMSVMKRLHLMGAGAVILNATNDAEKAALETAIGTVFKYLNKIYTNIPPKEVIDVYVPDLNPTQFRTFWDIAQEEIATDMNMSKKLISGDPQGAISSAKWDTEISYTEVYQTQRHYKKQIEQLMFKLGITDTTFTWNDPFPTESKEETPENGEETSNQVTDDTQKNDEITNKVK